MSSSSGRVPLLGALLLALAAALAVALVPAGLALDRQVDDVLRRTAIEDLGRAPMILEDRNAARAEALSMHAASVATTDGLAEAMLAGRTEEAVERATATAAMYDEEPVLVDAEGGWVAGPPVPADVIDLVRGGETAVIFVFDAGMPRSVALAPLGAGSGWAGAAGSSSPMDEGLATTLAALARSDVTLVGADGSLVASTLTPDSAATLVAAFDRGVSLAVSDKVAEVSSDDGMLWVAMAPVADAGTVLFSRMVDEELAALPGVRRSALLAGLLTLVLALSMGALVAGSLTRPVRGLADASVRLADGDFTSPVPEARIEEIDRLGRSFRSMRASLQTRIAELAAANDALEDRQQRLHSLQAELIRQDRLSSSARMAAELAHEIRNPVANVRNCLEVVRRGLPEGSEGVQFADMAIDELLRMHELAEHLLDLNRPVAAGVGACDPAEVARKVATLAGMGEQPVAVEVDAPSAAARVPMPPDALKQILFNLIDNAREAAGGDRPVEVRIVPGEKTVTLDVLDRGPGIDPETASRLFDPFFTTKDAVTGVGLGLFVAEGLARRYGGHMTANQRSDPPGALFRVVLPRGGTAEGGDSTAERADPTAASDDPIAERNDPAAERDPSGGAAP